MHMALCRQEYITAQAVVVARVLCTPPAAVAGGGAAAAKYILTRLWGAVLAQPASVTKVIQAPTAEYAQRVSRGNTRM